MPAGITLEKVFLKAIPPPAVWGFRDKLTARLK
jgi:hypothetical protein